MSEPRMISVDQAKLLMSVTDPDQPPIRKDWDDHLVHKLAATVVEHSEQIQRLQKAVRFLESVWGSDVLTELREKKIINPGDMEEL